MIRSSRIAGVICAGLVLAGLASWLLIRAGEVSERHGPTSAQAVSGNRADEPLCTPQVVTDNVDASLLQVDTTPSAPDKPPSNGASRLPLDKNVKGPGPSDRGFVEPPRPANTCQVAFVGPAGMKVRWDVNCWGKFDTAALTCPAHDNFPIDGIYWIKLTEIPGRPKWEFHPTLEIGPATPRNAAYLTHNPIPFRITDEDLDAVFKDDNAVTRVMYLPDPPYQEFALASVETLVSTRLDPNVDPITEADRRGSILAIIRMDRKFLNVPADDKSDPLRPAVPVPSRAAGAIRMPGPSQLPSGVPIGLPAPPHVPLGQPKPTNPPADPTPPPTREF